MSPVRLRRQPPAHSPLSARALASGLGAALGASLPTRVGEGAGRRRGGAGRGGAGQGGGGRGGEAVERLSTRLRREYGAEEVRLTDSGTSALTLALAAAAATRPGAPVALPAYGCYDIVTAAVGAGAPVVLYDLDPETLGPDPESLSAALEHEGGVAAVVVAHLYGMPVDVPALADRCGEAGVLLVEDAAQGFGGRHRGRPLGALGSLSVLSFGRGKGITGGGGGALLALDDVGREALVALEAFEPLEALERVADPLPAVPPGEEEGARAARGRARPGREGGRRGGAGWRELAGATAVWALGRPILYGLPASLPFLHLGETRYRAPRPPEPISAACAAIVDAAWKAAREEAAGRRLRAGRLQAVAEEAPGWRTIRGPRGAAPGYLRVPLLRVRAASERGEGLEGETIGRATIGSGARRRGIAPGYPAPLADLPALRPRIAGDGASRSFAGAEALARGLVTLPAHGLLSGEEIERLEGWLRRRGTGVREARGASAEARAAGGRGRDPEVRAGRPAADSSRGTTPAEV